MVEESDNLLSRNLLIFFILIVSLSLLWRVGYFGEITGATIGLQDKVDILPVNDEITIDPPVEDESNDLTKEPSLESPGEETSPEEELIDEPIDEPMDELIIDKPSDDKIPNMVHENISEIDTNYYPLNNGVRKRPRGIPNNVEVERFGFKFSNKSNVITSTEPYISCGIKPDNTDNNWKTCTALFEFENINSNRPVIANPLVDVIFNVEDYVNLTVEFSDTFTEYDDIYVNITTTSVNRTTSFGDITDVIINETNINLQIKILLILKIFQGQ